MKPHIIPITAPQPRDAALIAAERIERLRAYIRLLEDGVEPDDRRDMQLVAGIQPGDVEERFW